MSELDLLREKYPKFNKYSDRELAEVAHKHLYPEMPIDEFYKDIGYDPNIPQNKMHQPQDFQNESEATVRGVGRAVGDLPSTIGHVAQGVGSAILHPWETGKGGVAGVLEGTNTLLQNLPNNIVEWLRNRQASKAANTEQINEERIAKGKQALPNVDWQVPEGVTGDWASPETKGKMNKFVEEYSPEYRKDIAGPQLANTIGKYLASTKGAQKLLGPAAWPIGVMAQSIAENENPIQAWTTGKLLQHTPGGIKKGIEIAGKTPGIKQGVEKIGEHRAAKAEAKTAEAEAARVKTEAIEQTTKELQKAEAQRSKANLEHKKLVDDTEKLTASLLDMSKQKHEAATNLTESQRQLAQRTAQASEQTGKAIQQDANKMQEYAPTQEAHARRNLTGALHEKAKALREEANENFNNVYAEPVGRSTLGMTKLESPLTYSNMQAGYYTDALKYLIDKANAGHEFPRGMLENLYRSAVGEAHNPNYAPTVKQTVDFAKLVEKERARAHRKAQGESLPEADSRMYEQMDKKLSELQNDIWSDLEQNISPKQYANIREAFSKWGEIVKPVEIHPFFEDATAKYGKINTANAFEAMNKLGADELVKRLVEDPKVNDAIAKYDLMGVDMANAGKIQKLLDSDQGRALPKEARSILESQVKNLEKLAKEQRVARAITEKEIQRILNEPEIKKILQDNPEIIRDLDKIRTLERGIEELQKKMTEAGFKKSEVDAKTRALKRDIEQLNEYIKSKDTSLKAQAKANEKPEPEKSKVTGLITGLIHLGKIVRFV